MSQETIVLSATDGPTLTAAARASCIPTANRIVLPNNFFYIGRAIRFILGGRLSCAVTTPWRAGFRVVVVDVHCWCRVGRRVRGASCCVPVTGCVMRRCCARIKHLAHQRSYSLIQAVKNIAPNALSVS